MRTCYVAFDTETYRIVPGRLAPTPGVLTYATSNGTEKAVAPDEGARLLRAWCEVANTIVVGHNVAFDMGVMVAAYPDLVEPVFAAYAAGRVRDTVLREKLIRLASGEMSSDFGAGSKMTSFSMEAVFKVRFNEDLSALKTGDDAWRINYHRVAGVPLEQCWHDVPGGTARTAIDLTTALNEIPGVAVRGAAAGYGLGASAPYRCYSGVWSVCLWAVWPAVCGGCARGVGTAPVPCPLVGRVGG